MHLSDGPAVTGRPGNKELEADRSKNRQRNNTTAHRNAVFSYVKVLADLYIIYSNEENERLCALTQINFRVGGKARYHITNTHSRFSKL